MSVARKWRTDLKEATDKDCLLLTDRGTIISGEWRRRTKCWWVAGGGTIYPDQVRGWLPRSALPSAPQPKQKPIDDFEHIGPQYQTRGEHP